MLVAFLASFVEFVEALTVVLAVGAVRGWRSALSGAGLALATLAILVAVLGPALASLPQAAIKLTLGVLLLMFGMRWLRKAILRQAGAIKLHDEAAEYASRTTSLGSQPRAGGWDQMAVLAAFQVTMVEGIEVVFLVVGIGAAGTGLLLPASLGAAAALLLVIALGLLLHRPLSMVPENTLKLAVGVLVCALGTFWCGEGMGMSWPGGDWSLPALNVAFLLVVFAAVPACRTGLR